MENYNSNGVKKKKDKFPVWVIVLLIVTMSGFILLLFIGIMAAMTIPALVSNTDNAKNKTILKKTVSILNQSSLMGQALNGDEYEYFNDVWKYYIKDNLSNYQEMPNGIRLADLTEIKYEKLQNKCNIAPENPTKDSACAVLTIDTNGFDKAPNSYSVYDETGRVNNINDRFKLLLYRYSVVPESGSVEEKIIKNEI